VGRLTEAGSTPSAPSASVDAGLRPAYAAVRARLALVSVLFALAAVGWWWSIQQMRGMDSGPWTQLGTFGWFTTLWVVMMAAMMFPSVAPTVALYSRMSSDRVSPAAFVAGYLATWTGAGVVAYLAGVVAVHLSPGLQWNQAGRILTGSTLLLAAVYELTPVKNVCLSKCRSPLGLLLGTWREGRSGALTMGLTNGAWCVGCCWALMASLFALGIMSAVWMAVVAGLIAVEKLLPWRRGATYGTTAVLLALGVLVLVAPGALPGLIVPGGAPMPMTLHAALSQVWR
jgi:predicted metal-binding membrane protein